MMRRFVFSASSRVIIQSFLHQSPNIGQVALGQEKKLFIRSFSSMNSTDKSSWPREKARPENEHDNTLWSSLELLLEEEGCKDMIPESTIKRILDWHVQNKSDVKAKRLVSEFGPEYIYEYDVNPAVDRDSPDFQIIKRRVIEKCDKVPDCQ